MVTKCNNNRCHIATKRALADARRWKVPVRFAVAHDVAKADALTQLSKAALLKSLGQSRSSSRSSHGPKGSGQTSDAVAAPSSPTVVQDSIEVLGGLTPEEREVLEGSQVRRD